MNSLERLEHLTNGLPKLELVIESVLDKKTVSYASKKGSAIAKSLLNIGSIAIAEVIFSVGTVIAEHNHEEDEWLLVHDGGISVTIEGLDPAFIKRLKADGDTYFLGVGDYIYIPRDMCHTVRSSGGAKVAAITMPRSGVYPRNG